MVAVAVVAPPLLSVCAAAVVAVPPSLSVCVVVVVAAPPLPSVCVVEAEEGHLDLALSWDGVVVVEEEHHALNLQWDVAVAEVECLDPWMLLEGCAAVEVR